MTTSVNARRFQRTSGWVVIYLAALFATACGSATVGHAGRKWVGPVVNIPGGGQARTVIYYGPWQCRSDLMRHCESRCAGTGHVLQGCIWLADVKMDFEGTVVRAGGRYGITHCCCNYPPTTPAQTDALRSRWNSIRESFRERWAERFGAWPSDNGKPYPGHHVHDLGHGGDPTDWDNIFPYPKDLHETLPKLYNQCYSGTGPWRVIGPDYPYGE